MFFCITLNNKNHKAVFQSITCLPKHKAGFIRKKEKKKNIEI